MIDGTHESPMPLTMPGSERILPQLEALVIVDRDAELEARDAVERALAELDEQDFAIVERAVKQGWGSERVRRCAQIEAYDRGARNGMADPTDRAGDVKLAMFFERAGLTIARSVAEIQQLLAPLTYEQLVLVSEQARESFTQDQFLCDVICDEFGRRNQQIDPANYPSDGVS